ncbi:MULTISPECIES: hypothetical protein [Pseudomonas]|nr:MULTISPECIES: hypothetical protein [Pseudomonas]MEE2474242.1 hypothetical protein [Pseudomonas aeruginosa]
MPKSSGRDLIITAGKEIDSDFLNTPMAEMAFDQVESHQWVPA